MGLLGIITAVTFRCQKEYHVIGQESTTKLADCKVDFFGSGAGSGKPGLEMFLSNTEHTRLLWWPQKGVERVTVWQARNMNAADYTDETGTRENFNPKPYELFPKVLGSDQPAQILTGLYYRVIKGLHSGGLLGTISRDTVGLTVVSAVNLFTSLDDEQGPKKFWDIWWKVLPMDNSLSDNWIPYEFTEFWIPIAKTREVVNKLREHYAKQGISATGAFPCEIYAMKKSPFWMSPSYDLDMMRINLFWFANNLGNPATDYFPQFWELLKEFDFRLHWGKYLPADSAKYLKAQYPRWNDFMKIRAEMDPNQIFVTEYWGKHLGIE
jgi:hypothetical protein